LIRVGVVVTTIILGRDLHRADSEDGRQQKERPTTRPGLFTIPSSSQSMTR